MEVPPTVVEWGVRAISVALVAVLMSYLAVQAFRSADPPSFSMEPMLADVSRRGGGYELPVRVRNEGDTSVAELSVAVALLEGQETVDEESITVPFLGHGEKVVIAAWFDADPRGHRVEVRVGSYARR